MKDIRYVNLSCADNGYMLRWSEKVPSPTADNLDHCSYKEHELVFKDNEEEAMVAKFKALSRAERGVAASAEAPAKAEVY